MRVNHYSTFTMRGFISNTLYRGLFFVIVAVWITLFVSIVAADPLLMYELGKEGGHWSLRIFWIVITPGILKRFKVSGLLQDVQIVLMRSRRRLGILMFSLAVMHSTFKRAYFMFQSGEIPALSSISRFELAGLTAFTLLIPLFLTSNNFSVKLLKKNWKRLHALIYPALVFIALHMLWQGLVLEAYITIFFGVMQIASWLVHWRTMRPTSPDVPGKMPPSAASQG